MSNKGNWHFPLNYKKEDKKEEQHQHKGRSRANQGGFIFNQEIAQRQLFVAQKGRAVLQPLWSPGTYPTHPLRASKCV